MRIRSQDIKIKSVLYLYLFLFVFFTFGDKSISLTDYQIERICKKKKRVSTCIKKFQEKRSLLQKGNKIEIPVIPYKR